MSTSWNARWKAWWCGSWPCASPWRAICQIIAGLKISSDLERIADYASNVAKRSIALNQTPPVKPVSGIPRMGRLGSGMIKDVLDAFVERDAEKALSVWLRDEEMDDLYTSLFRELLTYMIEDPRNITPCTHLLFMAKNLERIGDHTTNIAETVYFLVHGTALVQVRPKRDRTTLPVAGDPDDHPETGGQA